MPIRVVALIAALLFAIAQTWHLALALDPVKRPVVVLFEPGHQ